MMKNYTFSGENTKKSHLFGVFGKICAIFLFILLAGCAKNTPTQNATQTLNNQIVALENSLTTDCKTDAVNTQITAIKAQISTIQSVCETEKAQITSEKIKWQWATFALLVIIAAYVGKTIARKF